METGHRSPLRVLAPIALVAFGIAFLFVIATSGGGGNEAGRDTRAAEEARDLGTNAKDDTQSKRREPSEEEESEEELGDDVYIVKRGDTLGGIAEETGVPVERLEELNPGLDQFSLVAGQRIKLR